MQWIVLATASMIGVVLSELGAWSRSVAQILVHRAARSLPGQVRRDREEEWSADLSQVPGGLTKIIFATQLWINAGSMARLERKAAGNVRSATNKRFHRWRIYIAVLFAGVFTTLVVNLSVVAFQSSGVSVDLISAAAIAFGIFGGLVGFISARLAHRSSDNAVDDRPDDRFS